jgi:hypothetical protein
MTVSINIHDAKKAEHITLDARGNDVLRFAEGDNWATLFVPPHVAEHTAAAFNRAMQAVPDRAGGWTYTTKSGVWHIVNEGKPFGFRAQHDDITGDNDPAWMFANAPSLIGVMDEIDEIEAEHECAECNRLVGDDALTELQGDRYLCHDCLWSAGERAQAMREMAEDDKAHAAREKAMGL